MKLITNILPKYRVTFEHPDDGSRTYDFCVDLEDRYEPGWLNEEWDEYHKELIKTVWNTYNSSGYWHTMTIIAIWVIDGKVHEWSVCEEAGCGDI